MNKLFVVMLSGVLAGCAVAPSTSIQQPMSKRPEAAPLPPAANGAIFQVGSSRPLFEDRKARSVGDTLTVVFNEKNSASLKANKNESHTGSSKQTMSPNIFASKALATTDTTLLDASSSVKYQNKDENTNDGVLSGSLRVTVVEVLNNGNLLVSGEKQLAVKNGTDYIRLSGVVTPTDISSANSVTSTQVADARIEYKSGESVDVSQLTSMAARFFLSVVPF
ncbi:MAG: flagellar basal body L-ring protein FlgH [Pseudomonadota bacterium]